LSVISLINATDRVKALGFRVAVVPVKETAAS